MTFSVAFVAAMRSKGPVHWLNGQPTWHLFVDFIKIGV